MSRSHTPVEHGASERSSSWVDAEVANKATQADSAISKIRVLLISASPRGVAPLRVDDELRALRESIRLCSRRELFDVTSWPSATIDDMWRALECWPTDDQTVLRIVHFAGHGTPNGFLFANELGGSVTANSQVLCEWLKEHGVTIALFNACYSAEAYRHITVPYAISMSGKATDQASIEFARGFYFAIGEGRSTPDAFKRGVQVAMLKNRPMKAILLIDGMPEYRTRIDVPPTEESQSTADVKASAAIDGISVIVLAHRNSSTSAFFAALPDTLLAKRSEFNQSVARGPTQLARFKNSSDALKLWSRIHRDALVTFRQPTSEGNSGVKRGPAGFDFCRVESREACIWLAVHPVTRAQYVRVLNAWLEEKQLEERVRGNRMTAELDDVVHRIEQVGDRFLWNPMSGVTWEDTLCWIERLNELSSVRESCGRYRLPMADEWRSASADIADQTEGSRALLMQFGRLGTSTPTPVGLYWPNQYGLLDLVGNVAEWTGSRSTDRYTVCGGSFRSNPDTFAIGDLESCHPRESHDWIGFRLVWEQERGI